MTGKAYVAICCSKALPLSIVRRPFLPIFIKEICCNLRLKISAFSEHFHFKGQVPLKYVGFTVSNIPGTISFEVCKFGSKAGGV